MLSRVAKGRTFVAMRWWQIQLDDDDNAVSDPQRVSFTPKVGFDPALFCSFFPGLSFRNVNDPFAIASYCTLQAGIEIAEL